MTYNPNFKVSDAFDKMAQGKIPSDKRIQIMGEAIKSAWDKSSDDPVLNELTKEIATQKIRNLGEESTHELLAKLGIWMAGTGVTEIP